MILKMDALKLGKIMSYLREYGLVENCGEFPDGKSKQVCMGKMSKYAFYRNKLYEKLRQIEQNFSVTIKIERSQIRDYLGLYVSEKG